MHIEYVRIPYWRTLRPRWVWLALGCVTGFVTGFVVGAII